MSQDSALYDVAWVVADTVFEPEVTEAVKTAEPVQPRKRPKPMAVSYKVDENYKGNLENQLKFGFFPQILKESTRLIGRGESLAADMVIDYVTMLLARLSRATYPDREPPEMDIYLSDLDGINTGIMTDPEKPVLVFGLGMLDKIVEYSLAKNVFPPEDELAPILGHERFHFIRSRKWTDLENGRPEESLADVFGIVETARAGYNPEGMGDFFKALLAEEKARDEDKDSAFEIRPVVMIGEFMDEHASLADRIRNSDWALAKLQLSKRVKKEKTPIPQEILDAAYSLTYVTHFERYKKHHDYSNKTPVEKLKLIAGYFEEEIMKIEGIFLDVRDKEDSEGHYVRDENNNFIREIKKKSQVPDELLMAHRLCEAFEDLHALKKEEGIKEASIEHFRFFMAFDPDKKQYYSERRSTQHKWVLDQFVALMNPDNEDVGDKKFRGSGGVGYSMSDRDDHSRRKMIGLIPAEFSDLITLMDQFWKTETIEEAVKIIDLYKTREKELKKYQRGMDHFSLFPNEKSLPHRKGIREALEEKGFYRLFWENQYQMVIGKEGTAEQKERVLSFLAEHVEDDERITGKFKKNQRWSDIQFEELHFDAQGNIISLDLDEDERNKANRAMFKPNTAAELLLNLDAFHLKREKTERDLVATIKWSEMDRDFWGFVEKYSTHLEPVYAVTPTSYPFAEAFMARLQKNLRQKPRKWSETYNAFMTGYTVDREYDHYSETYKVKEYSLPSLFLRSEEKYFRHGKLFGAGGRQFQNKRGEVPEGHKFEQQLGSYVDQREKKVRAKINKETGSVSYRVGKPERVHPREETVFIPLRADIHHPYVQALMNFNHKYMARYQKANMISHFMYFDQHAPSVETFFRLDPRLVFNHQPAQTVKGVYEYKHVMEQGELNNAPSPTWGVEVNFEILRQLRALDQAEKGERYPISSFLHKYITYDFSGVFANKEIGKKYERELKRLVTRQISRNARLDFKRSTPLEALIKNFKDDYGGGGLYGDGCYNVFATRPSLEKKYLTNIQERIMRLPLIERGEHLGKLMGRQLKDPVYRDWAIDQWVNSSLKQIGKDDGSEVYAAQAQELIKKTIDTIDSSQAFLCVTRLLDATEAQKEVSLYAKEALADEYGRKFLEKDYTMRFIESAIKTCAHSPILRQAFLDYITEPLTREGTLKFSTLVKEHGRHAGNGAGEFLGSIINSEKQFSLAPTQERIVVDYLHQNFWDMPFELRTLYLDRILFPVQQENTQSFDKAVEFVFGKVLPVSRKFAPEAREILLIYLDQCPKELRRTTFSALLATAEQAAKKGELRPGQVLSHVLTRTGSAGGQLLQALHSCLSGIQIDDPDLAQFRDDLQSSKVDFAKPFRWEIFERIDEVLPEDIKKQILRVGEILGCGSTAYVMKCVKESKNSAVKMMRKDVVEIADLQFERYKNAFEVLASRYDHYKPLPAMVDMARVAIDISTSGLIAKKQIDYAKSKYDDITVMVNGKEFTFDVAACLSAGPEYVETELVNGVHLNALDAGATKQDYATAIEAAELYRDLKGDAVDNDRHGGQQGLENQKVGMFDVCQLPYDIKQDYVPEPNTQEKRAYGQLLGLVFNAAVRGENVAQALANAITTREWGERKGYLVNKQRMFLARMDVYAGLAQNDPERKEIQKQIFKAVWNKGQIDENIFKGVTETLAPQTAFYFAMAPAATTQVKVDIQINDKSIARGFDKTLHTATMAKAIVESTLERIRSFAEEKVPKVLRRFKLSL